jgi:hypothetical protein
MPSQVATSDHVAHPDIADRLEYTGDCATPAVTAALAAILLSWAERRVDQEPRDVA